MPKQIPSTFLFFLVASTLFTSCQIEKRLYTGGYYVSSPSKTQGETRQEPISRHKKIKPTETVAATPAEIPDQPATIVTPEQVKLKTEEHVNIPPAEQVKETVESNKSPQPEPKTLSSGDDEKVKKDVWKLLLASILVFLFACLYEIFLAADLVTLSNIFFILTPFGIIGVWMLALLLRTKYKREEELNAGHKVKKERTIRKRKAFLLAGFLGIFGAHRFYLGYPKMALLEMFTLGGFFVLWFVDLIRIKLGKLRPFKGEYDKEEPTYSKGKNKKTKNRTQTWIWISLLISIAALLLIIGFAIF